MRLSRKILKSMYGDRAGYPDLSYKEFEQICYEVLEVLEKHGIKDIVAIYNFLATLPVIIQTNIFQILMEESE